MSATTTTDFTQMEYVRLSNTATNLASIYFDAADVYSNGECEKVLGKASNKIGAPLSPVVVATKVMFPVHKDVGTFNNRVQDNPEYFNEFGLSRKHILDAVDASLQRLDIDYIDLYIIHRFDPNTPIEETMEALNDVVRSGKIRYIGASSISTWQFQKINFVAEKNGWAKFVSMQNLYNLIYREEEREMIPYCLDSGIGMTPWSPLSGGELASKNRNTTREASPFTIKKLHLTTQHESNEIILDRMGKLAKKYDATYAQIAIIAWQFTKPYVTSPIIGASKMEQLHDLVRSLSIKLTEEDVKYLAEPYVPRNAI